MTTSFRNKVHTFFQDNDTSEIICNILEHLNTNDNEMIEILFMQLTHNGYLRMIMDFFKWCYPKTWEHLNKHEQKMLYSYTPTLAGKLLLNKDVAFNLHEKKLLCYATTSDFLIIPEHGKQFDFTTPNLIRIGGILHTINIGTPIECEFPYMAKELCVSGSPKSGLMVTINGYNVEDVKLESIKYESLHITVNGLSRLPYVPKIILNSVPIGEAMIDLPKTTDNLYLYTLGFKGENMKLKAKNIHLRDASPTKIVKLYPEIEKITTSEPLVVRHLLSNIRESKNIVRKIIYDRKNIKSFIANQIVKDCLEAGYKIMHSDENLGYIEFGLSNDGTI